MDISIKLTEQDLSNNLFIENIINALKQYNIDNHILTF